jgi:dihydrodipicolinate synthase/N-acetylneuraminate lyase
VSAAADLIRGICPILAVPFEVDDTVDLDGFDRIVAYVAGSGVTAAGLFGFASEFPKLSDAERSELQSRFLGVTSTLDEFAGIISITDHATALAVRTAQRAAEEGADALNLLPPHLLGPSSTAVQRHIEAVLDAVEIPVLLQLAPAQTGTSLPTTTLAEVAAAHPNLRFAKVESQPPGRYIEALARSRPPLPALVGYAGVQMPDALRRGAVGVQPGCSFIELYLELWRLWSEGQEGTFLDLHTRMLPYLTYWMQHVELIVQAEKTILCRRGIIATDHCRQPGWLFDREELTLVDRFLEEFDGRLPAVA